MPGTRSIPRFHRSIPQPDCASLCRAPRWIPHVGRCDSAIQNWRCNRAIPAVTPLGFHRLRISNSVDRHSPPQRWSAACMGSLGGRWCQRLPPRDRPHAAPGALVVGDSWEMPSQLDSRQQFTACLVGLTYRRGRCLINAEHARAWAGLAAGANVTDRDA